MSVLQNGSMSLNKHLSGLPFNSVTTTLLFVAFMIVSTTGIPYHLVNIFSCPKLPQGVMHPLSLRPVTSSINSFRLTYSFFVNSPFLWNTIPHTILRIKQPPLFRLALRRFLF